MTVRRLLSAMLLAVWAAGCVTPPTRQVAEPVLLNLSPDDLGRPLTVSALANGRFGDRSWQARVEIEARDGRLVVVALGALGVPFLTVEQVGAALPRVTSRQAGANLPDPRYMLFDLQMTHWPPAALSRALAEAGMRLVETGGGETRTVYAADGAKIAEIRFAKGRKEGDKGAGETHIRHYDIPYELSITPLSPEARQ